MPRSRDLRPYGHRRLVLTHLSPTALAADLAGWDVAHDGRSVPL